MPSKLPVLDQLILMENIPLDYRRQCSPRKPSRDNTAIDLDRDFMLPILGMEMRRSVVTVVHPDYNSEETADFRHRTFCSSAEWFFVFAEFLFQFPDDFDGIKCISNWIVE